MRIRMALGMAIAFSALMVVGPTTASAASDGYRLVVMANTCVDGVLTSNIKGIAGGATPANRIEAASYLERLRGGHWRMVPFSIGFDAKVFNPNGKRHSFAAKWTLPVDPGETLRIVYSFEIRDGDTALWDADIASIPCTG